MREAVEAVGSAFALTWPVLLFLVLITLVADLCADLRLFDVLAHGLARIAGGSVPRLFAAYCLLATLTTIGLSLDTTAVMLTPIGLALAAELGLSPRPFAFATVWLASAASLLLPISNLTNLLAVSRSGQSAAEFAAHLWLPQLVVLAVAVAVLWVRHRPSGRYHVPASLPEHDPVRLWIALAVALGIGVATVLGAPAWIAAGVGLVVLAVVCLTGPRELIAPVRLLRLTPAATVASAFGLFVVVEAVLSAYAPPTLASGGLSAAATGALLANAINNLPAWLALAPVTSYDAWPALLVGVNVGGLVLIWGTLANLLWRQRCLRSGLRIGVWEFAREGLMVAPLAVLLGALACR